MITINELRIGNIVNYRNLYVIVKEIHDGYIVCEKGRSLKIEEVYPIMICNETLSYAGLVNYKRHWYTNGLRIWRVTESMFVCDKNGTIIKTLHHLQNLHYAINNKELINK